MQGVTPTTLVAGGIATVYRALSLLNAAPPNIDYPESLRPYLGRKVEATTIRGLLSRFTSIKAQHAIEIGNARTDEQGKCKQRQQVTKESSNVYWKHIDDLNREHRAALRRRSVSRFPNASVNAFVANPLPFQSVASPRSATTLRRNRR